MEKTIAVIRGDGIGPEIVEQALGVLRRVEERFGHHFRYEDVWMGGCAIDRFGSSLPEEMLEKARRADAVLLGAVGGLSPLAINGIVAQQLSVENGIIAESLSGYLPLWGAYAAAMTVFSLAAYFLLGGLKPKKVEAAEKPHFVGLDRNQTLTLLAILVVLVGVIFFGQNIGLISFACAGVLLLVGAVDQKKAIAAIPWGTILLICGMSVLISVVNACGGIDFLAGKLENIIGEKSAQPVMMVLGGLMGAVSSGTGVVMPTLIPLAAELSGTLNISAMSLVIGVIVGTNGVVISPLSTVGGICVGCAPESVDKDKLYNQLLLAAVGFIVMSVIFSLIGVFNIFG